MSSTAHFVKLVTEDNIDRIFLHFDTEREKKNFELLVGYPYNIQGVKVDSDSVASNYIVGGYEHILKVCDLVSRLDFNGDILIIKPNTRQILQKLDELQYYPPVTLRNFLNCPQLK